MRKSLLVLTCLCLLAGPAWAGGGFALFGTYGQINEYSQSGGFGGRLSLGGERVVGDLTVTWFPSRSTKMVQEGSFAIFDSLQIVPIELGARYLFLKGKSLRPYIGAGFSLPIANLNTGSINPDIGYYGVAGLVWGDGRGIDFFAEVLYRWSEADITYDFEPEVFRKDLGGLAGSIGFYVVF